MVNLKFFRILIFSLFLFLAQCMVGNCVYADSFHKVMDPKYGIDRNKTWTIRFTKDIDPTSLNSNSVKVFNEASIELRNITLSVDPSNPKVVIVKPYANYAIDSSYNIIIEGIRTTNGQVLDHAVSMLFVTKSIFYGLPAEKGLVIVYDSADSYGKARAYTMDYLSANGNILNEIILSGKYAVYANNDENGTKVKSIFGNGNIDINSSYTQKPQIITYVDVTPGNINYVLNSNGYYDKVSPYAIIDATANKDVDKQGKVINLNVKQIQGIYDITKFKFSVEHSNAIKVLNENLTFYTDSDHEKISILSGQGDELGTINLNLGYTYANRKLDIDFNPKIEIGNTLGNIGNNGITAKDKKGYVFYNNGTDKNKLYKLNENGMSNIQISEDDAKYINTMGDYVYYSNYTDEGKLYKIKNDGSGKTKICDDTVAFVVVVGEDIYYSNHSDGGRLYTIKTDGSNAITKNEGPDTTKTDTGTTKKPDKKSKHGIPLGPQGDAAHLNVVGDNIYYINYSDNSTPYVVNRYGIYAGKVSDENMASMIIKGDVLYYTNSDGTIKKMMRDASGQSEVLAGGDKALRINISSDYLFYSNNTDGNRLYKLNLLDGTKQKLTNEAVEYISIVGNNQFYSVKSVLYKVTGNLDPKIKPLSLQNLSVTKKVTKANNITKIVSYADVNKPIADIEALYLPDKVTAVMDDGTLMETLVSWDRTKVTLKGGVRTYNGNLLGYNYKMILYLTIPSKELTTSQIKIYNSTKNGAVKVDKLLDGDIIKIYDTQYLEKSIAQSTTVNRDGIGIISKVSLPTDGKRLYFTITRSGRKESNYTVVDPVDAPAITSCKDDDNAYLGADARDITVNWTKASKNYPYRQRLYILPKGTALDIENQKEVYEDSGNSSESWTGDIDTKDSLEKTIKTGSYDVYVVADNGYTFTSSEVASVTLVPEDVLKQPKIPDHVFIHGGNKYILPFVVDRGITAWIVPITVMIDKTTNIDSLAIGKMDTEFTMFKGDGLGTIITVPQKEGAYKIVLSNLAGNSPLSKGIIHVDNTAPEKPTLAKLKSGYAQYIKVTNGDVISASSWEDGKIYLIKKEYYKDVIEILESSLLKNDEAALKATLGRRATGTTCKSGVAVTFNVEGIENGDYYAVAVDQAANVSKQSGEIDPAGTVTGQVINVDTMGPEIVSAIKRTLSVAEPPNDAGTDIANVILSEEGEILLVSSVDYNKNPDKYTRRSDLTPLINSRKAKSVIVVKIPNSNNYGASISAKGLVFGEYVLVACDKAGNLRVTDNILTAWEPPALKISTGKFDMDISKQTDIKVPMDLKGTKLNKLYRIIDKDNKTPLDEGKDYSVDVNTNTILVNKQYLQTIDTTRLNLGFEFVNSDIVVKNLNLYVDIVKMAIKPIIPKELISKHAFYMRLDKQIMDDEYLGADNIDLKVNGTTINGFDVKVLDGGYTYLVTMPSGTEIKSTSNYSCGIKSNLKYSYKYNFGSAVTFTPVSGILATPSVKLDKNGVATWNQVVGAENYEIKLYRVEAGSATQVGTASTLGYKQLLIDFNKEIEADARKNGGNGTYRVTVRAKAFDDSFATDSVEGKCTDLLFIFN